MNIIRRLILAALLIAGLSQAMAQVPAPVPALPDTERRTTYSISGSTCSCNVNFALFGDSTDVANWLTVWVNGVQITQSGNWTITSPSGSISTLARPITDAVLTFTNAQTGTVQIVGARRPRRTSQFAENRGVSARDLNQVITDLTAQNREFWDRQARTVQAPPGETLSVLTPLASRASMGVCFDSGGNLVACVGSSAGSFSAGAGITFTGTNPTVISWNPATSSISGTNLGLLYNVSGVPTTSSFAQIIANGLGTPTLYLGQVAPSNDNSALLIARNPNIVSTNPAGAHAIRDESAMVESVSGGAFAGYSTVDCAYSITGTASTAQNHARCFQARASINITGTNNEFAMFWSGPSVAGNSTVIPTMFHYQATTPTITNSPTITTQVAYHSDTLSGGGTNYFLQQGGAGNPSALPGNLYIGGRLTALSAEIMNVQFTSLTNYGMVFADTYAVAGTGTAAVFYRNGSPVGSISTTLAATAFNTSSDERLKKFHGPYDPKEAERIIRADPVRAYTRIEDGSYHVGWGAQTSYSILTDLATPGDHDINKRRGDKGFKDWGMDLGWRTPHLWAAMTDVLDRLDAIEQRINYAESVSRPANNAGIHYPRLGPNGRAAKAN